MVIDCHTHLDDGGDADKLLQSMDEAGIDASIVIAETLPGDVSNVVQVLDAVRRSDRLWALVNCVFSKTVELKYVEELTQLLCEERVVGLKFYLGYEEYSANDERLHQVYEYCEKQDVPIMFHTGVLEAGSTGLLEYSHPLQVDRVATRFPNLNIVMAHMGNPWLIDCAAVLAKNQMSMLTCQHSSRKTCRSLLMTLKYSDSEWNRCEFFYIRTTNFCSARIIRCTHRKNIWERCTRLIWSKQSGNQ